MLPVYVPAAAVDGMSSVSAALNWLVPAPWPAGAEPRTEAEASPGTVPGATVGPAVAPPVRVPTPAGAQPSWLAEMVFVPGPWNTDCVPETDQPGKKFRVSATVTVGRVPVATRPLTVRFTPVLVATVTVRVPVAATVTLIGIGLDPPAVRLPAVLTASCTVFEVEPANVVVSVGVNTAVSWNVPAAGKEVVVLAVPV